MFSTVKTGEIRKGIYAVNLGFVNFYVIDAGEEYIAIDTGTGKRVISELKKLGISPEKIGHVFLTHSDSDHTGGLKLFPNAKVYLSIDEEQMITGKRKRFFFGHNATLKRDYVLLKDNETCKAGNCIVKAIATPGHTPGSMSYQIGDILFTGDTLSLKKGKVATSPGFLNMDTVKEKESIRKIAKLKGIKMICTAHTGITDDFKEAVKEWV